MPLPTVHEWLYNNYYLSSILYLIIYIFTCMYIYIYIYHICIYVMYMYISLHKHIYIHQSHGSFARMVVPMVNRSILPSLPPKKRSVIFLFGHRCGDN